MVVGADGDDSMLKELYLGDPFEDEDTDGRDDDDDNDDDDDDDSEEGTVQDVSYNNWGDEASFDWDRSEQVGQGWMDSGRIKSGITTGPARKGSAESRSSRSSRISPRGSPKVKGGKKKPAR